jgi:hypothetical protein
MFDLVYGFQKVIYPANLDNISISEKGNIRNMNHLQCKHTLLQLILA